MSVYEPKEFCAEIDGWELFKKTKFNVQPVRRYCHLLDKDYTKNKVTVCANLSNLFNSFMVSKSKDQSENNFFDYEKWLQEYDQQPNAQDCDSPIKI